MNKKHIVTLALTLLLLFGSLLGTTALAAGAETTASPATSVSSTAEQTAAASESTTQQNGLGKQFLIILAFAAGVGLLAALYGLISMRYNAEKLDDMKTESKKTIEKMHQKKNP